MPSLALLLPSWLDLAGWAGVLFATLSLLGFGRLLSFGRATPEAALIAGWGGAVFLLTLWGVTTMTTMRLPAMVIVSAGIIAHGVPTLRLRRGEWQALARIAVLALPLLAVMASARPSQPDTWLNLLPNAAYLYDHGFFPSDASPPAHSFIAGAPYNVQLGALIVGLVTPGFPPSAMIGFNLMLLLAAGLLLARLAAGHDGASPSWGLTALGLLLATALNPGFVPRYQLSSYSETGVTVTVAFAGWFAARALDRLDGGRDARLDLWLFALALTALINIKQESIILVVGLLFAAALTIALLAIDKPRAFAALALAAVPAILLYAVWRWYVLSHFALGELKNLPFEQWHILELPLILWNMLRAAFSRIFLFVCVIAIAALGVWRLYRREYDVATRVGLMLAGTAFAYNAGLIVTYVVHFEGEMGIGAHSYFRYNTHLGLLLMAAFVLLMRASSWLRLAPHWAPRAATAAIVLVLLDPFPFLPMLRFDLEVPNLRLWDLAHYAAAGVAADEHLLLVLPGDNGSVAPALEGVLRYTPPRRPNLDLVVATDPKIAPAAGEPRRALFSCAPTGADDVPAGAAALRIRDGLAWQTQSFWRYPPVPPRTRWSQVLAPEPLCLGG